MSALYDARVDNARLAYYAQYTPLTQLNVVEWRRVGVSGVYGIRNSSRRLPTDSVDNLETDYVKFDRY